MSDLTISQKIGGTSLTDGDQYARIDRTTGALEAMEYEHHEIHNGCHYVVSSVKDISGNESFALLFAPASTGVTTRNAHTVFHYEAELEAQLELWEGVTHSGAGTAVSAINHRRDVNKPATMAVFHSPTSPVTTGATLLKIYHGGTASGPSRGGSSFRGEDEYILAPSINYLWFMKNATANNNHSTLWATWYEHSDKDEISLVV